MAALADFESLFDDKYDAIDVWADALYVATTNAESIESPVDFAAASIETRLKGTDQGDRIRTQNNEDQLALAMLEQNCENAIQQFRGLLTCSRCKSNKIFIRQKQSRAADEGMTLYCACECGKSWKM
jgi:DNA-directed RNA polymerase subunit M/transcription elongation factor TFIIS